MENAEWYYYLEREYHGCSHEWLGNCANVEISVRLNGKSISRRIYGAHSHHCFISYKKFEILYLEPQRSISNSPKWLRLKYCTNCIIYSITFAYIMQEITHNSLKPSIIDHCYLYGREKKKLTTNSSGMAIQIIFCSQWWNFRCQQRKTVQSYNAVWSNLRRN